MKAMIIKFKLMQGSFQRIVISDTVSRHMDGGRLNDTFLVL